ncbi:hemin uptake protein HemP [Rhodobacter lacus]|uniref:Hemin uptake protein HemP n=1 Tax=Rhodobacter lacus TaxID=1641972 RepID=A0ABW5ACQ6_9RHOB
MRPQDLPAHDARNLTMGGNLAQIVLDGQIYTLRITRQGKLILTK